MKKYIILIVLSFLIVPVVLATSGACSWHNGVNCSVGADLDGSVICNDGWRDSSVSYNFVEECNDSASCSLIEEINLIEEYGAEQDLLKAKEILNEKEELIEKMGDYYFKLSETSDLAEQQFLTNEINYILGMIEANCKMALTLRLSLESKKIEEGYFRQKIAEEQEYQSELERLENELKNAEEEKKIQEAKKFQAFEDELEKLQDELNNLSVCPLNSFLTNDNKCQCNVGYQLNSTKNGCVKMLCPANSTVSSYSCVCNEGYIKKNNKCITYTEDCKSYYGENVYGVKNEKGSSSCRCVNNYEWNNQKTQCILKKNDKKNDNEVINREKSFSKIIDKDLTKRLKGRILLQVESVGEAWYVNPKDEKKCYMANGNEAYNIMRNLGVGITNNDLNKVLVDKSFAKKHSGKIFLQVEAHGEAYYIDIDGNAHYLKDGSEAYNIMRDLGLGITNEDLRKIDISE